MLPPERSAELLDRLLDELGRLEGSEGLLAWARTCLPLKNTLLEADARVLEAAHQNRFEEAALPEIDPAEQPPISAVARSATSSPCRSADPTINLCTDTETKEPGGPTCRFRRADREGPLGCQPRPSDRWCTGRSTAAAIDIAEALLQMTPCIAGTIAFTNEAKEMSE